MSDRITAGRARDVESAILQKIEGGSCTLNELVQALPEYTWNQIFTAVDRLSRDGTLLLQRPTRFEYVIAGRIPCAG